VQQTATLVTQHHSHLQHQFSDIYCLKHPTPDCITFASTQTNQIALLTIFLLFLCPRIYTGPGAPSALYNKS